MISNFHTSVYGKLEKVPKTTDHAFRLPRSGELVEELAAMSKDAKGGYFAVGELTAECQKGDVLTWAFFCRDESGVGYEFFLKEWTVEADGLARNAEGTEWPKLTWD